MEKKDCLFSIEFGKTGGKGVVIAAPDCYIEDTDDVIRKVFVDLSGTLRDRNYSLLNDFGSLNYIGFTMFKGEKKDKDEIAELKKKLELEKARSSYWRYMCQYGEQPAVIGSKSDIEYITR